MFDSAAEAQQLLDDESGTPQVAGGDGADGKPTTDAGMPAFVLVRVCASTDVSVRVLLPPVTCSSCVCHRLPAKKANRARKVAVDMRQFVVIVSTLNKSLPLSRIASMYRDAFEAQAGGVTLHKFLQMADR